MEENKGTVYIITNDINDKVYIGKTIQPLKNRWYSHTDKWSNCRKLKEAMIKYGKDNFHIQALEENIPYSLLDDREAYYIKLFDSVNNGYNIKEGNSRFRGRKLHKISSEIKQRVTEDYKNGISPVDIAEHFKIGITSVYNILSEASVPKRHNLGGFTRNTKINLDQLIELKRLGYKTTYIADYFGVAKSSIKRYVRRHKDIIFPRVSDTLINNN